VSVVGGLRLVRQCCSDVRLAAFNMFVRSVADVDGPLRVEHRPAQQLTLNFPSLRHRTTSLMGVKRRFTD